MAIWENFENESAEYLRRTFGAYAQFDCKGGSDSTISDIEVLTRSGKHFYIEAKHCPAQCGQFVLLPNVGTRTFEYSRLNATRINAYSAAIMEHMNRYFDEYKEAGTAGRDVDIENGPAIFASWIVQAYKDKGHYLHKSKFARYYSLLCNIFSVRNFYIILVHHRIMHGCVNLLMPQQSLYLFNRHPFINRLCCH